jgi:hypothetical protein
MKVYQFLIILFKIIDTLFKNCDDKFIYEIFDKQINIFKNGEDKIIFICLSYYYIYNSEYHDLFRFHFSDNSGIYSLLNICRVAYFNLKYFMDFNSLIFYDPKKETYHKINLSIFLSLMKDTKDIEINNGYVKSFLSNLMDKIYNNKLLFRDSEMDNLNYIITREILNIK